MPPRNPMLILVTDRHRVAGDDLAPAVDRAVAGGVRLVILREKDLPASDLFLLACRLRSITRGRALLVVNDRVDVALATEADGVHLGETGLPIAAARQLGAGRSPFLVGRSVHTSQGATRAEAEGADYLLAGSIFSTASHPEQQPAGVAFLAEVAGKSGIPVYAIGGVTAANAGECIRAGAQGVAAISAILGAPDPEAAARELSAALIRSTP